MVAVKLRWHVTLRVNTLRARDYHKDEVALTIFHMRFQQVFDEHEGLLWAKHLQFALKVVLLDALHVEDVIDGPENHVYLAYDDHQDFVDLVAEILIAKGLQEHQSREQRLSYILHYRFLLKILESFI